MLKYIKNRFLLGNKIIIKIHNQDYRQTHLSIKSLHIEDGTLLIENYTLFGGENKTRYNFDINDVGVFFNTQYILKNNPFKILLALNTKKKNHIYILSIFNNKIQTFTIKFIIYKNNDIKRLINYFDEVKNNKKNGSQKLNINF